MTNVVTGRPSEDGRVIEQPQRTDKVDGGKEWVGDHIGIARVHGLEYPLTSTTAVVLALVHRTHGQGHRSARNQQDGHHHAESHVSTHVGREEIHLIRVDAAVGDVEQQGHARNPQHRAIPRPLISALV